MSNRLDIELEQDATRCRIGVNDDLVYLMARELKRAAKFYDFTVDRGGDGALQLAVPARAVIGDAVHHIAAAKALCYGSPRERNAPSNKKVAINAEIISILLRIFVPSGKTKRSNLMS